MDRAHFVECIPPSRRQQTLELSHRFGALGIVSVVAAWIPVHRAAAINPAITMRQTCGSQIVVSSVQSDRKVRVDLRGVCLRDDSSSIREPPISLEPFTTFVAARYRRALSDPERAQRALLRTVLASTRGSASARRVAVGVHLIVRRAKSISTSAARESNAGRNRRDPRSHAHDRSADAQIRVQPGIRQQVRQESKHAPGARHLRGSAHTAATAPPQSRSPAANQRRSGTFPPPTREARL
jgi:hypothetical protein